MNLYLLDLYSFVSKVPIFPKEVGALLFSSLKIEFINVLFPTPVQPTIWILKLDIFLIENLFISFFIFVL